MIVVMACLVKGEKVWGQVCNHQIVRVQIDACGVSGQEIENENFQFVTGSNYDIRNSNTSINVDAVSMSGFQPPGNSLLNLLNSFLLRAWYSLSLIITLSHLHQIT